MHVYLSYVSVDGSGKCLEAQCTVSLMGSGHRRYLGIIADGWIDGKIRYKRMGIITVGRTGLK